MYFVDELVVVELCVGFEVVFDAVVLSAVSTGWSVGTTFGIVSASGVGSTKRGVIIKLI